MKSLNLITKKCGQLASLSIPNGTAKKLAILAFLLPSAKVKFSQVSVILSTGGGGVHLPLPGQTPPPTANAADSIVESL